jgi:glycosyltransferase involved in cell wall biosynthesis
MLMSKGYYLLKPFLPWSLRVALRRRRANARRKSHAEVWPIDPKSGRVPAAWLGWPEKKQFAFVLTHDVEGTKGLGRVERVLALESQHGFRSSFNFVPEGEYRLGEDLRKKIEQAGFEVGVHGLKHDGKLYSSKSVFASRAARIRDYAEKWNACGFRSPLMQHRLDWLHLLGTEYDASTFDTDPFEPQPDGMGTIFPFWVPGPDGGGYVELPYTLAQDFTLFTILQEKNIDIWKQKVDWIAEHGGMVLLNTHPDYMCFDGGKPERDEFPVAHYAELLSYVRDKYQGRYWHALPREVSDYYRESVPAGERNSRKKICMVAYTKYESDGRVRRYAEALASRGDLVDIIAYTTGDSPLNVTQLNGVNVYHVFKREPEGPSKWAYVWRLLRFLFAAVYQVLKLHRSVRYDVIHVHNPPDFMVLAAWWPKHTGAKVIIDIHDIVPEFFVSKFGANPNGWYVKFTKAVEKFSIALADHVIVSNHIWQETLIQRCATREKSSVFVNNVDPAIFYRRARTRTDDKPIVIFPGSFQWHQGLDLAIDAFAIVKKKLTNAEFHLYGGGGNTEELLQQIKALGLSDSVKYHGSLSLDKIVDVIANADLGVVPKRANSFGNEAYSTKIMEFMSQGVPVVASRTKIDSLYFDDTVIRFFESGNIEELAKAMIEVLENQALRESLVREGLAYAEQHGWERRKKEYFNLVDSLATEKFPAVEAVGQREIAN